MPISEAGFFTMEEAEYHADPCATPSLSSSISSLIVNETMAEARWNHPRLNPLLEPDDETKFDLGNVAHAMLLGKGREIVAIDAPDWRTKAAKEQREDILAAGQMPCLLHIYEKAETMVTSAREQLAADPENSMAFVTGTPEQVAIADLPTPSGPIMARAMCDWIDRENIVTEGPVIWDYKTLKAGADPEGFARYLFREARDVQDPHYSLVVARILGCAPQDVQFRFVIQSAEPPHALCVVQLDEQAREFAFNRARYAIQRWGEALHTNQWPGFRPRTYFVAAPNFEQIRWGEKMMAEELAANLDARAGAAEQSEEY